MRAPSRYLALLSVVLSTILSAVLFVGMARAEDGPPSGQGGSEKRIALVVGNAAYQGGALATPANDAGLIAQTLQAAGFDVVGARDLDEDSLRKAMRDFTDKAAAAGPDTVAFVYLAGYGLQLNGENYFAPIDACIASAADVPVQSLRISDYKRRLASLPLKARFIVVDGARQNPFVKQGDPLAGGLALTEAEPGSLVAFNAAPGTIGPEEKGPYGAYAQALVEMIREGGLPPDQVFDRVRLRVSETTQGAEVPWHASRLEGQFVFFQREAGAPVVAEPAQVAALESRPLRELGAKEAYTACLKRDTLQGYQEFVAAYPRDNLAKRARALVAARRESVTWRKTYLADNPNAYWSYLRRYPRGPHAYDCRRRLRELSVALEPPARFTELDYDLPPPPPEEVVYVERPVVYFADPVYDLPPPPPPPAFFLPPPPAYIVDLAPPPPVYVEYALPTPAFVPLPVYVDPPRYVAPPPNNVYYQNIHNVTVINRINEQNVVYARQQRDRDRDRGPGGRGPDAAPPAGTAYGGAALAANPARVALPPALAQKAAARTDVPATAPATRDAPQPPRYGGISNGPANGQPGSLQANRPSQPGQALPGQTNGQPLPKQADRPGLAKEPGAPAKGDERKDDRTDPRQANRPDPQDKLHLGRDEPNPKRQAIKPGDPDARGDARPGDARPDAKPDPRQANRPDAQDKLRPGRDEADPKRQATKPGDPDARGDARPGDARPDAKPDPRQVNRPDPQDKLRPGRDEADPKRQAVKPGNPDARGDTRPGDARPDAKPNLRQADRPDPQEKLRPAGEDAAVKRQADRPDGVPGARGGENRLPAIGGRPPAGADRESAAARAQDAQQQRIQAQEQRRQALEQQRNDRQQAVQQRQQAIEQRQQQLQANQAERAQAERAQAAAQQRQQAIQQRAAQQEAAQAQRQQAAQQAAAQQRAAAQQAAAAERAQAAAQQRAAAQQQQMMQQRQMQQQAAQQQAAQQRQMMQQQAAQRQQMMMQQRQPPPGGRPGMPMR